MTIFGDLWDVAARTKLQGAFSLVWGVSALAGPLAEALQLGLTSREILKIVRDALAAVREDSGTGTTTSTSMPIR